MSYLKEFNILKDKFDINRESINIDELFLQIHNLPFESFSYNILPGEEVYRCNEHNRTFKNIPEQRSTPDTPNLNRILNLDDSKIKENVTFNYSIFQSYKPEKEKPAKDKKKDKKVKEKKRKPKKIKSKGVIILLHGLNEKDWTKYLPWAKKLAESTHKTVVLFPIAFHMNRAPKEWLDLKFMTSVNKERKKLNPNLSYSSFANAALSSRLQFYPQRFLWSGLQTYFDIIQLIREIKSGYHPIISKNESIDLFAYSIGSFLALILMMTNPYNYFSKSRLFNFCGGPTLNRMCPTSKFIMDSEANIAVYSFFIEHIDQEMKKDERLAHYFSKLHPVGNCFKSMLDYHKMKDFREKNLKDISKRVAALALKKDQVIPPSEVINTLNGENRNISIKTTVMDFKYKYDHINPFPVSEALEKKVDKYFDKVFKIAAKHLK